MQTWGFLSHLQLKIVSMSTCVSKKYYNIKPMQAAGFFNRNTAKTTAAEKIMQFYLNM